MNKLKAVTCIFHDHNWRKTTRFIKEERDGVPGVRRDCGFICAHCKTEAFSTIPTTMSYSEWKSVSEMDRLAELFIDRSPLTDEDIRIGRKMVEEHEEWQG